MRERKYRYVLRQEETGEIITKVFRYDQIFSGIAKLFVMQMKYCEVVAVDEWTGMSDKAGTEIFEGDILQSQTGNKNIWRVLFDDGSFVIEQPQRSKRGLKKHTQDFCCYEDIELYQLAVIGNIYEGGVKA